MRSVHVQCYIMDNDVPRKVYVKNVKTQWKGTLVRKIWGEHPSQTILETRAQKKKKNWFGCRKCEWDACARHCRGTVTAHSSAANNNTGESIKNVVTCYALNWVARKRKQKLQLFTFVWFAYVRIDLSCQCYNLWVYAYFALNPLLFLFFFSFVLAHCKIRIHACTSRVQSTSKNEIMGFENEKRREKKNGTQTRARACNALDDKIQQCEYLMCAQM